MSKKKATAEGKDEKQGEAEKKHYSLAPTPCATHHFTKGTESNPGR